MKNRSLVTQFRLAFTWIVIASIIATAITYALAAVLYIRAQYRSIYPANYYERQIPDIDAYIRDKNTALLLRSREQELQRIISGNGIHYQVLDGEGNYCTERIVKKYLMINPSFIDGLILLSGSRITLYTLFPLLMIMEGFQEQLLSYIS